MADKTTIRKKIKMKIVRNEILFPILLMVAQLFVSRETIVGLYPNELGLYVSDISKKCNYFTGFARFFIAVAYAKDSEKMNKTEEVKGFTMTLVDKNGVEKAVISGSMANILPGGIIEVLDVVAKIFDRNNVAGDILIHSSRGIYNRTDNVIDTDEFVRINRKNMVITGTGLHWEPDKEEMRINKNVRVEYTSMRNFEDNVPENRQPVTTITADRSGRLSYNDGVVAIFKDNVEIDDEYADMKAHLMKMYFDKETETLTRVEAFGNVKIKQPNRKSFCKKAVYFAPEDKMILTGKPVIIKGMDLYTADKITIFDKGSRVIFEPRAELIIYSDTKHDELE